MAELYRSDPLLAIEVINDILAGGNQAELLTVLRHMAQAFGGVQAVATQAHLNATQIYRTLSPRGNPALSSLSAILKTMGLQLAVRQRSSAEPDRLTSGAHAPIHHQHGAGGETRHAGSKVKR